MPDKGEQLHNLKWFALTGLFRHILPFEGCVPKYEYRTTLCAAKDRESAERTLLEECRDYADEDIQFLEEYEIFELDDPPGKKPVEVAHDMIVSTAEPETFIKTQWCRDRVDSCDAQGWTHAWHKLDGVRSGCYNCREVREGRLWEKAADHESEKP